MSDVRSNSELTEATASGLRWITLARVGTELVLLAAMVLLARLIPPAAFGMFALAVIAQELAIAVPSEGVGSALVQRRSVEREHLQGGLALSLAIGAVLGLVSLLLAVVLVRPVFGDETASLVMMTTPFFLVGAISAVPLAVLRRRLDFRLLSILELTQSMVRSLSSVALALVGLDAPALVFGGLIGMSSLLVLALIVAPVPLPRWRPQAIRDLLPYGGPAAIAAVSWAGFRNADYAIVGARLGAAQAGFYWRGYQLAVEYQRKVTAVMTQMGFPVLARTEGMDEMLALRGRMVRLLTVMLFPALVVLALLAPTLVPWLFGPAWEPAVLPTQILAAAGAACLVIDQVGAVLMAAGRRARPARLRRRPLHRLRRGRVRRGRPRPGRRGHRGVRGSQHLRLGGVCPDAPRPAGAGAAAPLGRRRRRNRRVRRAARRGGAGRDRAARGRDAGAPAHDRRHRGRRGRVPRGAAALVPGLRPRSRRGRAADPAHAPPARGRAPDPAPRGKPLLTGARKTAAHRDVDHT